jgi:outer membrane protein W
MKTIFIAAAVLLFSSVQAQQYKPFRAGIGFSYLNHNKPIAFAFDAGFRLNDYMLIGYRGEYAELQSNSIKSKGIYFQSYFLRFHGMFRPFVSAGLAQFTPTTDMTGGCGAPQPDRNVDIEKKIGIFTKVGFDLGHLSLSVETNLAARSKSIVQSNLQPTDARYHDPYVQYLTNSYATIKLSFFFWGGKKKQRLGL